MNNQDLQKLLARYASGNITPEELALLQETTHRDEVLRSSAALAVGMRRTRMRNLSLVFTGVLLLTGAGFWLAHEPQQQESQLVAVQKESPASVVAVEEPRAVLPMARVAEPEMIATVVATEKKDTLIEPKVDREAPAEVEEVKESLGVIGDMQILCNLDCNADSVLNDVLRFLNA